MTVIMYLYAKVFRTNTKVVHVLGIMTTGGMDSPINNKKIFFAGGTSHTAAGVLFSFAYFLLWNWGLFRINFVESFFLR